MGSGGEDGGFAEHPPSCTARCLGEPSHGSPRICTSGEWVARTVGSMGIVQRALPTHNDSMYALVFAASQPLLENVPQ
jgi:hypothetical protein